MNQRAINELWARFRALRAQAETGESEGGSLPRRPGTMPEIGRDVPKADSYAAVTATLFAATANAEQTARWLHTQNSQKEAELHQKRAQLAALQRQVATAEATLAAHEEVLRTLEEKRRRNLKITELLRRFLDSQKDPFLHSEVASNEILRFYAEKQRLLSTPVGDRTFWHASTPTQAALDAQAQYIAELRSLATSDRLSRVDRNFK